MVRTINLHFTCKLRQKHGQFQTHYFLALTMSVRMSVFRILDEVHRSSVIEKSKFTLLNVAFEYEFVNCSVNFFQKFSNAALHDGRGRTYPVWLA